MAAGSLAISREPVLTLWAAVVAERMGFARDEASSLGRAAAGLSARSKGRHLGVPKPREEKPKTAGDRGRGERRLVEACGRAVPAVVTEHGLRAISHRKPVDPDAADAYLDGKLGDDLPAARKARAAVAKTDPPAELAGAAYSRDEQSRPAVPEGGTGRGAMGALDRTRLGRLKRPRA